MFRRTMVALGALWIANGCIAQPTFDTSNIDPSGSAVGTVDEMVLIPATTLAGAGTTPAHHKRDHTNGGGKGKGKGPGKCEGRPPGHDPGGPNGGNGGPNSGNDGPNSGNDGPNRGNDEPDGGDCGTSSGGGPNDGSDTGSSSGAPSGPVEGADSGGAVVASFWIDTREVSVREYGDCVAVGKCSPAGAGPGCTAASGLGEHPITCVTRAQANDFCAWKEKRLVRDVEWTAASAGTFARTYPWGSDAPSSELLNACGVECAPTGMYSGRDPFKGTAPCRSFPRGGSPEGVFDLAGNVAEWVDAPDGRVRGGSYADVDPNAVTATAARSVSPDVVESTIGFRCARDR